MGFRMHKSNLPLYDPKQQLCENEQWHQHSAERMVHSV